MKRSFFSIVNTLLLLIMCFNIFIVVFSAEEEPESVVVSHIYMHNVPYPFLVLNKTSNDLNYDEKVRICLKKFSEYFADSIQEVPINDFKNQYYNIFHEEFIFEPGYSIQYEVQMMDVSATFDEEKITMTQEITDRNVKFTEYIYLKDYVLNDDTLYINIAVNENKNIENEPYFHEMSDSFGRYDASTNREGFLEPVGWLWEYDYFSERVDREFWNDYSDHLTLYTIKCIKDSDGNWYWDSCYLKNPNTSDKPNMIVIYSLLFISITAMTLIICKKKKKDINVAYAMQLDH